MSLAITALIFLAGLMAVGALLHRKNLDNTYRMVVNSSISLSSECNKNGKGNMKKTLLEKMFTPQGSNFIALSTSAWLLLFVAAFFSFLLTPQISEDFTFLKIPSQAASPMGFLIFGSIALSVGFLFIVTLKLPQFYCFYTISRKIKIAIMSIWILLWVPIFIPAYLATIYPYPKDLSFLIDIGFILLVVSQFILLSPIYFEAMGVEV